MSNRKKLTTEELIIMEFKKWSISTKMRAIVCLIKKVADKNFVSRDIAKQLSNTKDIEDIINVIITLFNSDRELNKSIINNKIDFEYQITKEIRMQAMNITEKKLIDIIITVLLIDNRDLSISKLYSLVIQSVQTSQNIHKILEEITKKWKFNSFLDMFVGRAELAKKIIKNHKEVKLIGNDINSIELFYAIINLYIEDIYESELRFVDSIVENLNMDKNKYDLIVSEIPLLEKYDNWKIKEIEKQFNYGVPKMYSDYLAIQRILDNLSNNGRAIIVVANGTLFRIGIEQDIRKKLINQDLVEAVITLPEKMYDYTLAQTNILILNKNKISQRKNVIQFIDATQEFTKKDFKYIIEQKNISNIIELYEGRIQNNTTSVLLTNEEMKDYNYSLFIWNKYNNKIMEQKNKDKLTINKIAEIIRGIQITKERYEKAKQNGNTHYYITASDINSENGKIELNEDSLIRPEERWIEKCEIQNKDIIITMKGNSLKIGLAINLPKCIVSGNLIIIRIKKNYDPYVLIEYLKSPKGSKILKSIQRGTSISIINPEDLGNVSIPDLSEQEQKEIKEKIIKSEREYNNAINEIENKRMIEIKEIYKEMKIEGD